MNDRAQAVLDFWFDEMVAEKRFKKDKSFDELIKEKFGDWDHSALDEFSPMQIYICRKN